MPVSLPQVRWPDLRHQGVMSGDGWHPPPLAIWRIHLTYMCFCSLHVFLPQGFPSPIPCRFLRNQRLPASKCKLKLRLHSESLALCGVLICSDVNNIYLMREKIGFKKLVQLAIDAPFIQTLYFFPSILAYNCGRKEGWKEEKKIEGKEKRRNNWKTYRLIEKVTSWQLLVCN